MSDELFGIGDRVYYTGEKFKMELTSKDGKPFTGWIHAATINNPDVFVVEYPDTKEGDSYVMHRRVLSRAKPPKTEAEKGPEVQPRRKKKEEAE